MANLASVLGRIPGYGGFAARREQHEAEEAMDARMELQARQLQSEMANRQQMTADRAAGRLFQEKQLAQQAELARENRAQTGLQFAMNLDLRQQDLDRRFAEDQRRAASDAERRAFEERYKMESLANKAAQDNISNELKRLGFEIQREGQQIRLRQIEAEQSRKTEGVNQAREQLGNILGEMREHYKTLNEAKAIPSSERSGAQNIISSVQSSQVGQMAGRALGTKEQDARNQIQSSRLRIMNAIRQATGMTAKALDSNVELKLWLDALTSLGGTYESNIGIINAIEKQFLGQKGSGAVPAGVPPEVWNVMTEEEKALWRK